MQRIEAWQTKDGAVHGTESAAVRHEFMDYARSIYDESAVAMMLQDPGTLRDQLDRLLIFGKYQPETLRDGPSAFDGVLGQAPAITPRKGQFLIPTHLDPSVVNIILAGVELDIGGNSVVGNNRHCIGCHPSFEPWSAAEAGRAPPVYEWTMLMDESLNRAVTWKRKT